MLNVKLRGETLNEAAEQAVSPAPVLITEHEVALGTAVALHARPTTRRRWVEATHALLAALHRTLVPSPQDGRPAHYAYPRRYAFLESACMAREMDRL
jgi:hypothetical protein